MRAGLGARVIGNALMPLSFVGFEYLLWLRALLIKPSGLSAPRAASPIGSVTALSSFATSVTQPFQRQQPSSSTRKSKRPLAAFGSQTAKIAKE